jgi:hypothetical protein
VLHLSHCAWYSEGDHNNLNDTSHYVYLLI